MNVESTLLNLFPKTLQLPIKFHYRKLRKRLEPELFFIGKSIKKGKRAIDVGANEGMYSYLFSQKFDVVEAFEPQSTCTELLSTYNRHHKQNINIHNVGLSNFCGTSTLRIPVIEKTSPQIVSGLATFTPLKGSQQQIEVPVHKLDSYKFEDVSLIKIDVEGHESQVIEGGVETISRENPVILVEIEQRHLEDKPIEKVFEQIVDLGYEGFFLDQQLHPLSKFSYEQNQKPYLEDIFHQRYTHNFLFYPISKPVLKNKRCKFFKG